MNGLVVAKPIQPSARPSNAGALHRLPAAITATPATSAARGCAASGRASTSDAAIACSTPNQIQLFGNAA